LFNFGQLNTYTFHISLYDLFFFVMTIAGLTFALLLGFVRNANRSANRFLALALFTMILWMMRVLAIDVGLDNHLLHWDRFPTQFLLALGPLFYFYVLKITRPQCKFTWKDMLHFSPLVLEQGALVFQIRESNNTGAATYATQAFQQLNPVLQLLIFISMMSYLYKCNRLIQGFYRRLQPVLMDRPLVEFRWLRRLLAATALLWCVWIVCAAAAYFVYHGQPGIQVYYPFYIFFAVMIIWTAAAAFLKPQAGAMTQTHLSVKPPIPVELRAKAAWLKKAVEANRYYEDPELSLGSLAEKLRLPPHELSRVINTVFRKNFNDFINEYRVRDVVSRMQDPAFDNMTLLGIAFEAGFNSKSTFNRTFRQLTGKTPAEFNNHMKNKGSSYHLTPYLRTAAVISSHQPSHNWAVMKPNRQYMFENYFKTAWRSLIRNKIYSLVNVIGLALGICACLAIYLITRYEFSFDNFHPDRDRIYCVDAVFRGGHLNSIPGPMPATMRREMTGLETVAGFQSYKANVTIRGSADVEAKHFSNAGNIAIADPHFFSIFRYQWLSGNAASSLAAPNSVVLTAKKARQYFGELTPDRIIGRTLYYEDSLMVTVTGVVADWKGNSDFDFSQWISYATIPVSFLKKKISLDAWNTMDRTSQVMVKLAKDVKPSQIDAQFTEFAKRHEGPPGFGARLRPLSSVHFHEEYGGVGRKASLPVLYTLMAVAGFILVLAIINFVNLSTAQSMQRAREIGVRKVLGGSRSGIAVQFFTETLLLTVAAVAVAALMLRPVFNWFADMIPAGVRFRLDGATLLYLLLVIVVTTFFAGFYPAKVLGNYQPTVTLKGITAVPGGGKGVLRRGLIVFQFTISLLFIIASFVIGSQLRYVLHADLGFKTDAIITIKEPPGNSMGRMAFMADASAQKKAPKERDETAVLMDQIRQLAGVEQVIREFKAPMDQSHWGFGGGGLKNSNEKPIEVSMHLGNEDFVPFYGMKLVAGRNLLPASSTKEVLISESFAHAMGFADMAEVIGREVVVGPDEAYPVAGVVADFFESSFHKATWPIVIRHDPAQERLIAVKIAAQRMSAGELKTLIEKIEEHWKSVFPGRPFGYSFLDESIANMYADDLRTGRLVNVAMGITVFISCLGLLGLAIFSTQKRTREIGIRKVLGATVRDIMVMLCKDIILLIVIALLIASPLAWYFMHSWLQGFAYRTTLSAWLFIAAGAAAIGIALLTVSLQATRAARANPVKSLRTE
jgi:putative ABC transport system permease protein